MDRASPETQALAMRCLRAFDPAAADPGAEDFVFDAHGVEAIASRCAGIVLEAGDEARAAALLAAGAPCVLIGQAALRDGTVVQRLAAGYGAERIGIHACVKRQSVSWSLETTSNADFKTVTPSLCEPAWEVLDGEGDGTGTLAAWWLPAMRDLGASRFLVRVDVVDDTDLNLCAGLVETLGEALWLGPLTHERPRIADWVRYGHARRLALPAGVFALRDELLAQAEDAT